ncbi:Activator of Hsp90 ATPase 1 family protein [Kribbella flavida DSM 17836]|uniref:Activator of Hsp90 ATPase 1 family protein n=1 Tax=Kribbella flavida (strain DSM 17836 / JCM 10339 / NBRC 14399) TaxID=479435 RepID=D2PTM2_KRIFD|nr:SRPBCC domain-containing protein [Kribbella flavida]ADB31335.1 Activator of Hsp90 ATPase 1 family protein [Kribbella flavida DSM 17836]
MERSVEREVYVDARPDQVWNAVTQPESLARWYAFGGAELDLRPGGQVVLRWDEHGEFRGFVEKVEPGRRFAYRYAVEPGVDPVPGNSNLVEFTLTPEGEGTRLTVVESGFDRLDLPEQARAEHADNAEQGWDGGLAELATLVKEF